jgi:hypothetical protein
MKAVWGLLASCLMAVEGCLGADWRLRKGYQGLFEGFLMIYDCD